MDDQLSNLLTSNKVVGYRQVVRGIADGNIRCVVVAADTDEHIKSSITSLCKSKKVKLSYFSTKAEIGKLLNIDVACAVVGLIK